MTTTTYPAGTRVVINLPASTTLHGRTATVLDHSAGMAALTGNGYRVAVTRRNLNGKAVTRVFNLSAAEVSTNLPTAP